MVLDAKKVSLLAFIVVGMLLARQDTELITQNHSGWKANEKKQTVEYMSDPPRGLLPTLAFSQCM